MPPVLRLMVEPHMGGSYEQFLRVTRAADYRQWTRDFLGGE